MGYHYDSSLTSAQKQAQQKQFQQQQMLAQQQAQQRAQQQSWEQQQAWVKQQLWTQQHQTFASQGPPVVRQQPEGFWHGVFRKISELSDKLDGPPSTNRNYPPQPQRPIVQPRPLPPPPYQNPMQPLRANPFSFPLPNFAFRDVVGTGYYPHNSRREGGFHDRHGRDLYTLQDYLQGKAPYVAVAMDRNSFVFGQYIRIPILEQAYNKGKPIIFKLVDTGGHFKHRGTTAIDICTANKKASEENPVNRTDLVLYPISETEAARIDQWRAQYQGK